MELKVMQLSKLPHILRPEDQKETVQNTNIIGIYKIIYTMSINKHFKKKKCVVEIKIFNNILKVNDDKTELFIFSLQRQVDVFKIFISATIAQVSLKIQKLGVKI